MRSKAILQAAMALLAAGGGAARGASHLMRYADVHGDSIVFTYEDDLWLVSTAGRDARRITSDRGSEMYAKFSPDGSRIAFTAEYDGGNDVYVMDARGGVPVRFTYHPAADGVLDWFPDGGSVLFRSRREYPTRGEQIYRVSIDGGMPEKLPVDRAGLSTLSPDAKQVAYNRISRETHTWKRHQGGTAQDIWLGSFEQGDFRKITDWPGTDNYPMWVDDAIYFTSDRAHGTLNIYKYDLNTGAVTAMTEYTDYDVKFPSAGTGKIVYQYGEALHLLDLADRSTRAVPVNIHSDRVPVRPEFVEVRPKRGSFRLSPGGKRLLMEARGELLNLPVEDGDPINLTKAPASREKGAVWSPDGRWIAFISDKTGEEEVYLVDQKAEQPWRQLTENGEGFRMPLVWSPDSKYLAFSDKFMKLNLLDVEAGTVTTIDQGDYDDGWERWGIQDYVWSPDSRWIAYTKMEQSLNESVFLYSIEQKAVTRVTSDVTEDFSPSFDPQGRFLYFLSYRSLDPVMDFIDQNYAFLDVCRPYLVLLQSDVRSPFAPKDSQEPAESEEPTTQEAEPDDAEDDGDADDEKAEKPERVEIDLDGIARRIVAAEEVPPGNYFRLEATDDGFLYLSRSELQFEKYQSVTDETDGTLDLYSYDLEERSAKQLIAEISNYHLSSDGKKLVYRAESTYGVVDVGEEAEVGDGEVELDGVRLMVERAGEFMQIFNEAWRVQRDWFYDANMHGVDWKAIGEKYRRFVADCGDRSDLNYLIGEMIGELNAGHTYVRGGDIERDEKIVETGMLGVSLAVRPGEPFYVIEHIIPSTPGDEDERSPLDEPGCPIKEGSYLIGIDGQQVTSSDNVYAYLQNKADAVVTLQYNDRPTAEGAKSWRVRTIGSETAIRYREWVERNRRFVDDASGGLLGYVHIPDMGASGLVEFARAFHPQYYRNGLIIDERYNGGGFTADMIIDRLERRMWGMTQPREGKPLRDPERIFFGPLVVIINEDTGSSGEMFAEAIKRKKIAALIGMRTWGGSVGIEPHQDLVDSGVTTPPQFGLYGLDGTWLIEGHGVDPDIEVQNMPGDVLRGKDVQLEAAVAYVLKKLEESPVELPGPPPYPDKSKGK